MNDILRRLKQERRRALILLIASLSLITLGQWAATSIQSTDTVASSSAGSNE